MKNTSDYIKDVITKKKYYVKLVPSSSVILLKDGGVMSRYNHLEVIMKKSSALKLYKDNHPCFLRSYEYSIGFKTNAIEVKYSDNWVKIATINKLPNRKKVFVFLDVQDNFEVIRG